MKRLGLVLCAVGGMLLLAEIALRVLAPQPTHARLLSHWPSIYRPSEVLPYELIPNRRSRIVDPHGEFATDVTINSLGYRGREFTRDKGDRKRVLVLGDSFTFGWGVADDQTYSVRLETELRRRLGDDRIEVINAGFASGFYPDAYYLYLKAKGVALEPDLIVVGFYIGNDIVDFNIDAPSMWRDVEDGLPTRLEFVGTHVKDGYLVVDKPRKRYRTPWLRDSHLYQAVFQLVKPMPQVSLRESFNRLIYCRNYPPRVKQHMELVRRVLAATHAFARSRQIPLLLLVIPAREQVHAPSGPQFDPAAYDLDKPNRVLRPFFLGIGLPFEDLLPALRRASETHRYYFVHDNHWNADGHVLAASRLAERIVRMGVLE